MQKRDNTPNDLKPVTVSEVYTKVVSSLKPDKIPPTVKYVVESALLDVAGLCMAARNTDYVQAVLSAWDGEGKCTALGHTVLMDAAGAAVVNGTAAHGEDYDDTFEGTPVHAEAVIIPAVLAACEHYDRSGGDALCGMVAGMELMCRLALVAPTAIHRAGFHPTAVIGTLGAAVGVGVALGHSPKQLTDAMGVAGSMASGIIEYLAEGTVHRLWEPSPEKKRPSTPYSAKFSGPFCVAVGLVDRAAGLIQFSEEKISDPHILALAELEH